MRIFFAVLFSQLLLLGSCASQEASQDTPSLASTLEFKPLFDFRGLSTWEFADAEQSSFVLEDNILRVSGDRGWLHSSRLYVDFVLRLDFRFLEANSDSGVFLRAGLETPFIFGWPGDSYQVQVRDISENTSNNPLPLANVYRHLVPEGNTIYEGEKVQSLYSGVGEWQHYEIIVLGDQFTVRLNGELVATAQGLDNLTGHIGFQSERGVVEYRNIEIYEF